MATVRSGLRLARLAGWAVGAALAASCTASDTAGLREGATSGPAEPADEQADWLIRAGGTRPAWIAQLVEHMAHGQVKRAAGGFAVEGRSPGSRARATLGDRASDFMMLTTTNAGPIRVRRVGARGAVATLAEGILTYEHALPNADALVFPTANGIEDLLVVRGPTAALEYELDLPRGWSLHRSDRALGLVEARDSAGHAQLRMWARAAVDASGTRTTLEATIEGSRIRIAVPADARYPLALDPEWQSTDTMVSPRSYLSSASLPDGRSLIAGGDAPGLGLCEIYDPLTGTFTATGSLLHARFGHALVALPSGDVLVVGGVADEPGHPVNAAEVQECERYRPTTGSFVADSELQQARASVAAALLRSGKVLVLGGSRGTQVLASGETYDPQQAKWTLLGGTLTAPRWAPLALLLDGERVLVAGGRDYSYAALESAEIFDVASESSHLVPFPPRDPGNIDRTIISVPSGRVLVPGCRGSSTFLYDPLTGVSTDGPAMTVPRCGLGALVLPSGDALLLGGDGHGTAELLDPAGVHPSRQLALPSLELGGSLTGLPTGKVLAGGVTQQGDSSYVTPALFFPGPVRLSTLRQPVQPRCGASATLLADGRVLVTGGSRDSYYCAGSAEIFDPVRSEFRALANTPWFCMDRAALLDDGSVFTFTSDSAGGRASVFDPASETFAVVPDPPPLSYSPAVAALPTGDVLVAGGASPPGATLLAEAWLLRPDAGGVAHWTFVPTGPLGEARHRPVPTELLSGDVLVAGGDNAASSAALDRYVPASGQFVHLAPMLRARRDFTASLLSTGEVLLAGGQTLGEPATNSTEIYQPSTDLTQAGPNLSERRRFHTATALESDQVLVAGGRGSGAKATASAELFDPGTRTFSPTGPLSLARFGHAAVRLPNGQVLVVGGAAEDNQSCLASAEIYDPAQGVFSPTSLPEGIGAGETVTVLPDGRLLVAGGGADGSNAARILDAESSSSSATSPMLDARSEHTSTLVGRDTVLVLGGRNASGSLASAEIYRVGQGAFLASPGMQVARSGHSATVLPNGDVLVAGGAASAAVERWSAVTGELAEVAQLAQPRSHHAAVLLRTGLVAIVGGSETETATPVTTLELFDPVTNAMATARPLPLSGPCQGLATASGDALVAGTGWAYVLHADTLTLDGVATSVSVAFGLESLVSGDVLLGTKDGGALVPPWGGAPWAAVNGPVGMDQGSIRRLMDGSLLVRGLRSDVETSYRVAVEPEGVVRPTIESAPSEATLGEPFAIEGTRFQRMSAVGSANQPSMPDIVPTVAFMPAAGGGPIYGTSAGWSDTGLSCTFAHTPYHGPGWLHVIVQGVWSRGRYVELRPRQAAQRCGEDFECGSGFCTDGVCCDRRCLGACESCLASEQAAGGQDGACGPLPAESPVKADCTGDPLGVCGITGLCDGQGHCAFVAEGTECASDRQCRQQQCVPTLGSPCTSNLDCASGQYCSADRVCERSFTAVESQGSSACSVAALGARDAASPSNRSGRGAWLGLLGGCVGLLARGRRKAAWPRVSAALRPAALCLDHVVRH